MECVPLEGGLVVGVRAMLDQEPDDRKVSKLGSIEKASLSRFIDQVEIGTPPGECLDGLQVALLGGVVGGGLAIDIELAGVEPVRQQLLDAQSLA
jgi:hypothetical protein